MKIDGIAGDSTDAKHKGEIDVESWSWGESQTAGGGGAGGAVGRVVRQDFHFVVPLGKQSPKLFTACASGQHIKTGTLVARRGETQVEFLKIVLTDFLVTSYNVGASQDAADPTPRDQFSLRFNKIEMTEVSPSPIGAAAAAEVENFDFQANNSF